MKKNIFKILATAFAVALIVASPATAITSHAMGFNPGAHDKTERGEMPSRSENSGSSNSSSNESSQPAPAPKVEDNSSSNSGGSNYGDGYGFNPDAHDDTERGEAPSRVYSAGGTAISNTTIVSVTGGQKFCSSMSPDHTVYQVYYMGISRASFAVEDEKGNAVVFDNAKLEKGADGLWYENITLPKDVDTEGLTVTVTKGDASYLATTLGVNGIKLNGEVVELVTPATDAK